MIKSLQKIPMVEFDSSNKEHRLAYHNFLKYNTWSKSKFRFILEDTYIDIPTMISDRLLRHYLKREFTER